jgi:hypothetical protein
MDQFKKFLVVSSLILAACQGRWRLANDFRSSLKCGMSTKAVESLAIKYQCSTFRAIEQPTDGRDHALFEGSTSFWFWFSADRLVSFQEGRYSGGTELRTSVIENLCTGQRTAEVTLWIVAPDELAGASVYIDEIKTLGLSNGPTVMATIGGLKSGKHQVRIEKNGYKTIARQYDYTPTEYWPRDNEIRVTIARSAVEKT